MPQDNLPVHVRHIVFGPQRNQNKIRLVSLDCNFPQLQWTEVKNYDAFFWEDTRKMAILEHLLSYVTLQWDIALLYWLAPLSTRHTWLGGLMTAFVALFFSWCFIVDLSETIFLDYTFQTKASFFFLNMSIFYVLYDTIVDLCLLCLKYLGLQIVQHNL